MRRLARLPLEALALALVLALLAAGAALWCVRLALSYLEPDQ